jgi:hypothetical protein
MEVSTKNEDLSKYIVEKSKNNQYNNIEKNRK